ncbi:MAG: hypothetical protein ACNFW9_02450 [Candidatus Kerfeldbacteria bacterium]|jgi:hypothetical protein
MTIIKFLIMVGIFYLVMQLEGIADDYIESFNLPGWVKLILGSGVLYFFFLTDHVDDFITKYLNHFILEETCVAQNQVNKLILSYQKKYALLALDKKSSFKNIVRYNLLDMKQILSKT